MILQPYQPSTPSKHHWGQSWNNHLHHSFYSFHVYIAPWEVSCLVFTMPRMNHQTVCLSMPLCGLHYSGKKEGLPTELGKYFQHCFTKWYNFFNSKMVLKFIVGLTILELLIKKWTKILFWTIQLYLKKLQKPHGLLVILMTFLGFQAFIFKESESYHSPTLSLTAS